MNETNTGASRRLFLGGVAGTLGAAALPTVSAHAAQSEKNSKVETYDSIVIGAGFAGLAAARDLSKKGHSVLLLEARNRIGGRTFTSQYNGTKIELGGTWVHWTQPNVWNEITRYGLDIVESPGATPDYLSWLSGKKVTRSPAGAIWQRLSTAMEHFCNVDGQAGRVVMPRPHDPLFNLQELKKWDSLTLQDRLNSMKFNQQTRDLLSPQLSINCHNALSQGGFADMLRWWGLGDYDMGRMFDKLGRFKINDGMSELANRMLKDSNSDLRLATPVKSIKKQDKNYVISTAKGESFLCKSVVLAVPINTLSDIQIEPGLNEVKQKFAKDGQTGRGTKCYIHIKEKIGNWMGSAPYPNPITLTFTEKQREDGTLLVAFGPPNLLNITDEEAVEKAIRTLIPKANVIGVTGYQWDADPYSKGTWCWYRPNQLTQGLNEMRRAEDGIFMAGADVAKGWRGFVDGALESGITAAQDVSTYLKKS